MEYYYRVTVVFDLVTVITTVSLDLDEHTGNLSAEARKQALYEADNSISYDLGEPLIWGEGRRPNEITVTLLLDDDTEIELENE